MKITKSNNGKLKILITMIQERIATGHLADATTRLFLVDREGVCCVNDANPRYEKIYGEVFILHPSIIAGTWQEFFNDVSREVIQELLEKGLVVSNEFGYIYFQEPKPQPKTEISLVDDVNLTKK